MEKKQELMDKYGLFGRNIEYSFSRSYFKKKFEQEQLQASYVNFDCKDLDEVKTNLYNPEINGYNVTIPYKTSIMSLLDEVEAHAKVIGAVNTIKRTSEGATYWL